ncbi:manganese efflux pump MntP [Candidatus Harpocratesius sp.]
MLLVSISLSMDRLALAVSCGLQNTPRKIYMSMKVAFIFAIIQALTPIIGYFAGTFFANLLAPFDHWFALLLLGFIGGSMINEGIKNHKSSELIILGIKVIFEHLSAI